MASRILFQSTGTFAEKEKILHIHMTTSENTILCGPSLTEGLNLYDDLGRFNILMKLPYLSLADPLFKRKSQEFPEWYQLQVALAIIQATGRTVRSITDWSVIYILDRMWKFFYDTHKDRLIPKYIQEAVRWLSSRSPLSYK
jgi:Rad3-related DNA helicase